MICTKNFYKPNEVLLGLPHMSDYNAEAHAQYQVLLVRSVVGFSSNLALTHTARNTARKTQPEKHCQKNTPRAHCQKHTVTESTA